MRRSRYIRVGMALLVAGGLFGVVRPSRAMLTTTTAVPGCTGWTDGAGIVGWDRDNTGEGMEHLVYEAFDGAGTQILNVADDRLVGALAILASEYPWDSAPASNPITLQLRSPAGNGQPEQVHLMGVGACSEVPPSDEPGDSEGPPPVVEAPVPGCDVTMAIPATAVGGTFTAPSELYWAPGTLVAPLIVFLPGQDVRVIGLDASGGYYKILFNCTFGWVRAETIGPNYDEVWQGAPLPVVVVE